MTSSNGDIFRVTRPLCGNSPVTGEFPTQRPVTRSLSVFFGLSLNKRLNKQSRGWWFETPPRSLWRHCDVRSNWMEFYATASSPFLSRINNIYLERFSYNFTETAIRIHHWRLTSTLCLFDFGIIYAPLFIQIKETCVIENGPLPASLKFRYWKFEVIFYNSMLFAVTHGLVQCD